MHRTDTIHDIDPRSRPPIRHLLSRSPSHRILSTPRSSHLHLHFKISLFGQHPSNQLLGADRSSEEPTHLEKPRKHGHRSSIKRAISVCVSSTPSCRRTAAPQTTRPRLVLHRQHGWYQFPAAPRICELSTLAKNGRHLAVQRGIVLSSILIPSTAPTMASPSSASPRPEDVPMWFPWRWRGAWSSEVLEGGQDMRLKIRKTHASNRR